MAQHDRQDSDFLTDLIIFYKTASVALQSSKDGKAQFVCPICKGRAIAQRDEPDKKIQAKCLSCGFGDDEEEENEL